MNFFKSNILNSYKRLVNRRRLFKNNVPNWPHHKLDVESIYCKEESRNYKFKITVSLYSDDGIDSHRWEFWSTGWKKSKEDAWSFLKDEIEKIRSVYPNYNYYKQVEEGNFSKSVEL